MANENEGKPKLTGDVVFVDLIDKVCQCLYLVDLCRVARVCKSWNAAVKRELQRRGLQKISLFENLHNLQFLNRIETKPHIVLMFATHQEFNQSDPNDPYPTVSYQCMKKHVETTVLVGSSRLYTEMNFNTSYDKYDECKCLSNFRGHLIPCLIIPKHRNLDAKFISLTYKQVQEKSFNHRTAIDPLLPTEKQTKTFLMLFTFVCEKSFLKKSFNYIKEHFQGKSYALWGSELFFPPLVDNPKNNFTPSQDGQIGFVGISISSANMEFFSTVFLCKNMKISEFYQDLVKLKENVKLKQHSFAFISGPWFEDYYLDTSDEEGSKEFRKEEDEFYGENYEQEYLYYFKKIFPNVPFIGTFQNSMFNSFGIGTSGSNKFLMHEEAVSIVIVTYK